MDATTDRQAFESLVQQCQAAVCAVAYSVLRDRSRSEEVAQEAFLVAWLQRSSMTATPGWICGIARNLARNAARRRKEVAMNDEPADLTRGARDELIARHEAARAAAALGKLPERHRDAIVLYYRAEQSIAEVATALGISEASARQRVHRGRKALRDALASVEASVRATRPGPAFTAACVAFWIARGGPARAAPGGASAVAIAAATGAAASWVGGALAAATLSVAALVGFATGSLAQPGRATTTDPRAALHRRFPVMAAPHATTIPAGSVPITAAATANGPPGRPVVDDGPGLTLDFANAPLPDMVHLLANQLDTPVWIARDPVAKINLTVTDMPALAVLDEVLAQAGARRTEVAALRIVPGGDHDAAVFGGEPMTASFRATPVNQVLSAIEPHLAMPIGRLGLQVPPGIVDERGEPVLDQSPAITLELHDTPAGLALEQVLDQIGYGYELTTGFVITPDDN